MTEPDALEGFVPVSAADVRALDEAAQGVGRAKAELAQATQELLELAEDMKTEAVRRLVERGASSAQVERYDDAFRAVVEAMRARSRALDGEHDALSAAVRAIRG